MFKNDIIGRTFSVQLINEVNHKTGLYNAGNYSQLWSYIKPPEQDMSIFLNHYIQLMIDSHKTGESIAYVVISNATKQIVGASRYYEISELNKKLCIGYTWYQPDFWGTGINAEVKYLLLSQVFDHLNWNRVGFHVDTRNARSISAMTYLGAKNEGTLRKHKIVQGDFVRDTQQFGITNDDWPKIKQHLLERMKQL